jgi:hypothetical protein
MKQKYRILLILPIMLVPFLLAFTAPNSITAALPPRPTVEPAKTKQPGAYIQLQLSGAAIGTEGVWTIVQWVDEFGVWNDVTGWQGTVELDGTQTWWVAPEDMGSGPFRWRTLSSPTGGVLATSDEFMLPDQTRVVQVVPVEVE